MPNLRSRKEIDKEVKKLDAEDLRMFNFAKQNLRPFYRAIDKANEGLDAKDKIKTPITSKDIENDDVLDGYILDCLIGEKDNEESMQSAQKKKRIQQKANLVFQSYHRKGDIREEYKKKYGVDSLVRRLPSYTAKIAKEDGSDRIECEKHNVYENFMYGNPEYKQVILEEHFKKIINFDFSKVVDLIKAGDPEKLMDYSLEKPEIINSMFTTSAIFCDFNYEKSIKEISDYHYNIMPVIDGVGSLFQGERYTNFMYRFFDDSSLSIVSGNMLSMARQELVREKAVSVKLDKNASETQKDSVAFWRKDNWANYGEANDGRNSDIELAEYIKDPLKYKAVQIVNDKEVEVSLLQLHEGKIKGKIVERTQEERDILNGELAKDGEKEHYKEVKKQAKEMKEAIFNAKSLEELEKIAQEEAKRNKAKRIEIGDKNFNEQFDKLSDRQKQLFNDTKIMYAILADGAERYNSNKNNTKKINPVVFNRWKVLNQVRSSKIDIVQQKATEVDAQKENTTALAKKYYKELGYDENRAGEDLSRAADGILLSENNSHGYDGIKRQNMADIALLSSSRSYIKPLQKIIQNKLMKVNFGEIIKYGVETDPIKKLEFYQKHEDDLKALFGAYKSINIDDNKAKFSNNEARSYLANMNTFFEGIGGLFKPDTYKDDMLEFLPKDYSNEELVGMTSSAVAPKGIGNLSKEERKTHHDNLTNILMAKVTREDYQNKVESRSKKLFNIKSLIDYKAVNAQGKEVPFDDYVLNVDGVKLVARTDEEKAQIQKMFAKEHEYEMDCRAKEIEFTRKLFEKASEKDLDSLMKTFSRNRDAILKSAGFLDAENTGKKMNETVAKNQKIESLSAKKREYAKHNFLWKIFMPKAYRSRSEISKAEKELESSMTPIDKLYLKSAEKNSFDKKGFKNVINGFKKNYENAVENTVDKTKLMSEYASIIKYIRKFPNDFSKSGITTDDITATAKTLLGKENESAITEIANERELQNIDKKLAETFGAIKERNSAVIMQKLEEKKPNELLGWVKLLSTEAGVKVGDIGQEKQQEVNATDISTEQFYENLEQSTKNVDSHKIKEEKVSSETEIGVKVKKGQDKGKQ